MRVRSVRQGFIAIAVLLSSSSFALGEPRLIVLDPSRVGPRPEIVVKTLTEQNIIMELNMPALEVREIETKSGVIQMVSIPGEPLVDSRNGLAVPTIGRLLVVPSGATATTEVRVHQTSALEDLSLPQLPAEKSVGELHGREPQSRKTGEASPLVQIGEPHPCAA